MLREESGGRAGARKWLAGPGRSDLHAAAGAPGVTPGACSASVTGDRPAYASRAIAGPPRDRACAKYVCDVALRGFYCPPRTALR